MRTTAVRVCTTRRTWSVLQLGGLVLLAAATAVWLFPGHASAAGPSVTIPTGTVTDGQSITVTGSGFPAYPAQDPSGLSVIECSDPGGLPANLPTDATGCDGTSQKTFFQDTSGNFSTDYTAILLNAGNSSIDCDQSNFCVLWVGVDFNTDFTSNSAFSAPFEVQPGVNTTTTTTTSTTSTTVASSTTTSVPTSTTTSTTPSTSSTTTSVPTTTSTSSTSPTSTSTTSGDTTSTSAAGGTTTTGVGGSTTTGPATGAAGGTAGGGSGGAGPVSASSGALAFTGGPSAFPWLIGFGIVMTILGTMGRRLIPRRAA